MQLRTLAPLNRLMAALAVSVCSAASAQDLSTHTIDEPQRLSAWLGARTPTLPSSYMLGLMWLVDSERVVQERERAALLSQLALLKDGRGYLPDDVDRLMAVVAQMPVTGRVLTAAAEPRWLEADPRRDPMLLPGDRVQLASRPRSVAVLNADGRWCHVLHSEAAVVSDYLRRCRSAESAAPDWAWLIQPDGRIQKIGVAAWNLTLPQHLAPGARIWVPPRAADEPATDEALARWLSWQGAAADPPTSPSILELPDAAADLREGSRHLGRATDNPPTTSDWGFVGLMQTPTTRMREAGTFSLSFQRTSPYTRANVFFQPLDALEVGFRYVSVSNRLYGSKALSGDQDFKDKSIDFKLRVWSESRFLPEVALGVLDMGGTGLFGSEYLVANKRWGAWDASLGLGWGYLGNRRDADNPLGRLRQGFNDRPGGSQLTGQGGTVGLSRYFRGPVGIFGGVQYRPANGPMLLKLELDGNNYQREPQKNVQPQRWPVNLGLVYQATPGVDLNVGLERGNKASIGIAFTTPLARMSTPKSLDARPVPVSAGRPTQEPDLARTAGDIAQQTGWQPASISADEKRLQVDFAGVSAPYPRERLDRTLAVMHRDAPASVDTLEVRVHSLGDVHMTAQADRAEWVSSMTEPQRSNQPHDPLRVRLGADGFAQPAEQPTQALAFEPVRLGVRPAIDLIQSIGGPDGFVLYQFSAAARASLRLPAGWTARGHARIRLIDNYDRFRYDGPSQLPRVRTLVREYLTTSRATLESLTLSRSARLGGNHFYAVYAGYFETMFGGVGGEWLYRRPGSRWALGVDANRVRQRDFHQDLRWRDYQVDTGHATLYWDTGWNGIRTSVSAGQYLAGDRGATVALQKVFPNGVSMSAFATKTNVSAAKFGEGSFDKGITLSIPFDAFLPRSSGLTAGFVWRPLTRDGGAMVARPVQLINDTVWLDPAMLSIRSAPPPNDDVPPDDRIEPWTQQR